MDGTLMRMTNNQETNIFSLQIIDGFMTLVIQIDDEDNSIQLESMYNQADGKEHTIEVSKMCLYCNCVAFFGF